MKKIVEIIHKWLAISDFKYRDKSKIQLSLDLIDEEIKELKQLKRIRITFFRTKDIAFIS